MSINQNSAPAKVHIKIKPIDGSEPIVHRNIAQYVLITIPEKDAEHNSEYSGIMGAQTLAEIGVWFIQVSKALANNTPIPALGEFIQKDRNSPIIQPGRLAKKNPDRGVIQ